MAKERILITAKTYPTLSRKYGETVCTAGIREDGSWVRIYPVPFRRLEDTEQYRKYDWIECELTRNKSDQRPESHRPVDFNELRPVAHLGTDDNWRERRRLLLKTARVYTKLSDLIDGAKANQMSLAVFKPAKVMDLVWEEEESRDWDQDKLREMREQTQQMELFEDEAWRQTFKIIPKLPYNFSYRFQDENGKASELQILDWEIGALFWNCRRKAKGDEKQALAKVREKYLTAFLKTDLHFFLGTMQRFHGFSQNPWIIIGVLPIPQETQMSLL